MDNNTSNFLPQDNPARIMTEHLETEYGDEITIIVGIERPCGTVLDSVFLSRVKEFTDAAEDIELVKNTNSLMSTQYLTADNESTILTDLVNEGFSGTPEEIAGAEERCKGLKKCRRPKEGNDGGKEHTLSSSVQPLLL